MAAAARHRLPDPALGGRQARHRHPGRGARRAHGPAPGRMPRPRRSCTCCWRITARTRPRRWHLRRAAGSGATGLAGMAAVREVPGLRLLRPLLAVPKTRLLATLAAAGQPWLVDPANAAETFARGRLRADPAFVPEVPWAEGFAHAEARQRGGRAGRGRARPTCPAALAGLRPARRAGSGASWSRRSAPTLLGRLLATVGGRPYPVADGQGRPSGGGDVRRTPATLGGCIIVRCGDDLVICREPGRIRHRLPLRPGSSGHCGMGALRCGTSAAPCRVEMRALGPQGAQLLGDAGCVTALRRAAVPVHGVAWTTGGVGRRDAGGLPAARSVWVVCEGRIFDHSSAATRRAADHGSVHGR